MAKESQRQEIEKQQSLKAFSAAGGGGLAPIVDPRATKFASAAEMDAIEEGFSEDDELDPSELDDAVKRNEAEAKRMEKHMMASEFL